jgi:hypothetical protein
MAQEGVTAQLEPIQESGADGMENEITIGRSDGPATIEQEADYDRNDERQRRRRQQADEEGRVVVVNGRIDNDNDSNIGSVQEEDDDDDEGNETTTARAAAQVLASAEYQNSSAAAGRNGSANDNNATRIAEQAIMGAENAGNDNANIVQPLEVIDESGILIQQRFVEFLANLYVRYFQ